jgi:amidophosphoribosyltransferase
MHFFETSCFDGQYITGDITAEYLNGVENQRSEAKPGKPRGTTRTTDDGQLDLNLASRRRALSTAPPPNEVQPSTR